LCRNYNSRMRMLLLLGLLFISCLAAAQTAADLASEPHYQLLLENASVRVFILTLHPDESAFVRFQRTFMTVTLQDGQIIIWDEGKAPIQHFQAHKGETSFQWLTPRNKDQILAGGYKNDQRQDYRNITVEFLDPNLGWALPMGGTISPPASMYLGGALVADVLLQRKDEFPAPEKKGPELVIPLSDMDLKAASGLRIRKSSGEVVWIPEDSVSGLVNHGKDAARFIVVEFETSDPQTPTH
jgi:hypothetical protein